MLLSRGSPRGGGVHSPIEGPDPQDPPTTRAANGGRKRHEVLISGRLHRYDLESLVKNLGHNVIGGRTLRTP